MVSHVSKQFSIPVDRVQTLKERVLHPVRSSKRNTFPALQDVSLAVQPGEFFGLVGRNGSGKSTLLKCIAGIYQADAGSIYHSGTIASFIELGVGFNPQLAAYDNVVLNATLMGRDREEARASYQQVMDFAELWEFENLKLKNYSSGMYVRLAFSVMLQVDADIMLIDEILAVGDAAFQQKCFDEFDRMKAKGKTIIFVTHGMDAVKRFCDRAALIEKGRLLAVGPAEEVGNQYLTLNFEPDAIAPPKPDAPPEATLLSVWVEDAAGERDVEIASNQPFSIIAVMRIDSNVKDPRVVVRVLGEHHEPLMRFETDSLNEMKGIFAARDTLKLRIEADCPLAPGRHLLSVEAEAAGSDSALFAHEAVADFVVAGERRSAAALATTGRIEVTTTRGSKVAS